MRCEDKTLTPRCMFSFQCMRIGSSLELADLVTASGAAQERASGIVPSSRYHILSGPLTSRMVTGNNWPGESVCSRSWT